ncbi:hypothetical protein DL766_001102 [Monosporascus sp. MC13-8B]|uniref:Zn(2)-C6 fungal-type domain-containing protein n=1 Tax=Monosporascus cannonballus TaxID=155416 RepID=A0ABY0HAH5_9PEZI|nr:hypothetical protein DL762_004541 [Monosporascus cannonballus]RYP38192.1 hypothetical protein DL766_001102 [Monosporascus sp. MC13-8B]
MSLTSSAKAPRILACVLCQTRKVKCDRQSPCSNCVKAKVSCVPSTPAPARKRRRPNQDLQQRLARCEELLSEYATAKQPDTVDDSQSLGDAWKPQGKLVADQSGGVKFMDSLLWSSIHDELHAMRQILDGDDKDDECSTRAESLSPGHDAVLLLHSESSLDLKELHPPSAHVFFLWQKFLDRVNPLTKVIHVPTLQPMVAEAAANIDSVPRNVEALLFSIYTVTAVSLSDEELILQTLVLYMTSLFGRYDRHAAWILNGVIVRMAQKMGLHRDGESLGLPPFEAEMRRRVWWQIIMLDTFYALMSGLGQSLLPRNWNTRAPHNINDADLYPSMTSIESREGPTDMIFVLMQYEVSKLIVQVPSLELVILQNELATPEGPNPVELAKARRRLEELNETLDRMLEKWCDLSMGPVHELAMEMKPTLLCKLREIVEPPRNQPEWGTEIQTPKDNLFRMAITSGEHSLRMVNAARRTGQFIWFVVTHFQIELFIYMLGQLSTRTSGQLVERAWAVTEANYTAYQDLFDLSIKPHLILAAHVRKAWKVREKVLRERNRSPPQPPVYILRLDGQLTAYESKHHTPSGDTPVLNGLRLDSSNGSAATPVMDVTPWDQMLGFIDAGAIDWDALPSTLMGDTQSQVPFAGFTQPFGSYADGGDWM